nr:MAG TPA: hypothetical protein [Caudoviricetes sp.]
MYMYCVVYSSICMHMICSMYDIVYRYIVL